MQQQLLKDIGEGAFASGYVYEPDFLLAAEEFELLQQLEQLPFQRAQYKQFQANRRIVSYGGRYDYAANRLQDGEPVAPFLQPLRARAAAWSACAAEDFTHVLIAQYASGVRLGWHRDAPVYEMVAGVSLRSACRMRFRRYPPQPRQKSLAIELEPRSIYCLKGEARWDWQHSVPPVPALRYSITFRKLKPPQGLERSAVQ